jgi:hypothetical protein
MVTDLRKWMNSPTEFSTPSIHSGCHIHLASKSDGPIDAFRLEAGLDLGFMWADMKILQKVSQRSLTL